MGRVIGLIPFSLSEWAVLLFFLALLTYLVATVVRMVKTAEYGKLFARLGSTLLLTVSLVYGAFIALWGTNYYAEPLHKTLGLVVEPQSVTVLSDVTESIAVSLNASSALVLRDENGVMRDETFRAVADGVADGYTELGGLFPEFLRGGARPKTPLISEWMSYAGITGIYIPFLAEPNVNGHAPASSIPFTTAHEVAHSYGFAKEDEANFIAYLACRASPHGAYAYSGDLAAFVYCYNALAAENYDRAAEIYGRLNSAVRADLSARAAYWKAYEGPVQETASAVNDGYLRAMATVDGVKSYGRVVDLIIADYLARGDLAPDGQNSGIQVSGHGQDTSGNE
ncbi:DUF3810 domain-containing protein [Oscillospiraceae bacterium OttesenSCG-928-F05]|nr:DUF3810 domain-containing protein [Oscillospiraceae bacterium OttesenSCG-928-F05]